MQKSDQTIKRYVTAVKPENRPYAEFKVDNVRFSLNRCIQEIESGNVEYFTRTWLGLEAKIHIAKTKDGTKYLRSNADQTEANNLSELPIF